MLVLAFSRATFCAECKSAILHHTFRRFRVAAARNQPIMKELMANLNSATNANARRRLNFGVSTLPFRRMKLTSNRLTGWIFLKFNQIRGISHGHVRQKILTNADRLRREELLKMKGKVRWSAKIWENIAESPFKMATPVFIGLGLLYVMKEADPRCFQARLKEMTADEKAKLQRVLKAVGEGFLYSAAFTVFWCFVRASKRFKTLNVATEAFVVVPVVWVAYISTLGGSLFASYRYHNYQIKRLEEQKKEEIKDPNAEQERMTFLTRSRGYLVTGLEGLTAILGAIIIGGLPRVFGEAKEILKTTRIRPWRVYSKLASFVTLFAGVLAIPITIAIFLPDDCVLKHKFIIELSGAIGASGYLSLGAVPHFARVVGSSNGSFCLVLFSSPHGKQLIFDKIATRGFFMFRSVAGLTFFSAFFMLIAQDTLSQIENSEDEPVDLFNCVLPVVSLIGILPFYVALLYPMALGYKVYSKLFRGLLI